MGQRRALAIVSSVVSGRWDSRGLLISATLVAGGLLTAACSGSTPQSPSSQVTTSGVTGASAVPSGVTGGTGPTGAGPVSATGISGHGIVTENCGGANPVLQLLDPTAGNILATETVAASSPTLGSLG